MKNIYVLFFGFLFLTSCAWRNISSLTIIANRNIEEGKKYQELQRNVEGNSNSDIYVTGTQSSFSVEGSRKLDVAIQNALSKVPGGEFLKNVQIYLRGDEIKVVGDVWGINPSDNPSAQHELLVGDNVMWKSVGVFYGGTIISLQGETVLVKYIADGKEKFENVQKQKLSKVSKDAISIEKPLVKIDPRADNYAIGDKVTWKEPFKTREGIIIGKDNKYAEVQYNDNGNKKSKRLSYGNIAKLK